MADAESHLRIYRKYSLGVYVSSAVISLIAFFYGLLVAHIRPGIWKSSIFKILIVVQASNCLRFVFRILGTQADITAEFGCRAVLYLNNIFAIIPVYLSVYCVVYLQLVVVHKVSTKKRWPRILLLTICMVCSLGPNMTLLFISHRSYGIASFCRTPDIPGHRFYWVTIVCSKVWMYFPGAVGIVSMTAVSIYILRTSWDAKQAQQATESEYGAWSSTKRCGSRGMLHRTLVSIVWFPLTPVVALWFNVILFSVRYYKKRAYVGAEFVSVGLLALQSVFLAIALVVNPLVMDAVRTKRREAYSEKHTHLRNGSHSSAYESTTEVLSDTPSGISPIPELSHFDDEF
ncbi:hypothetical protein GQ54DRAFT_307902 [Martensiomyces pterosporus]|nr:hypothetical protein GQ54DRAFT_307902 [Martensiomyces pterosporus]